MKCSFDNKKLNNKGIAISGVMYMILIVSLLLVVGTLRTLHNRKSTTDKLKNDTIEELTNIDVIVSARLKLVNNQCSTDSSFLDGGVERSQYEIIKTVSSNKVPNNAIDSWDVSEEQNGGIMAWYLDEDNNGMYELYIGQNNGVMANPDSKYLFQNFSNVTSMDLSKFDTSNVTDMSAMFAYTNSLQTLKINKATFTSVTTYSDMFLSSNVSTIYVKDATAQTFINSRLSDAGLSSTVIIAS